MDIKEEFHKYTSKYKVKYYFNKLVGEMNADGNTDKKTVGSNES